MPGVGVLQPVGGTGEQAALGGALGAQFAAAVDLFGDVGQVEVRGEGAHELGGGLQVGAAEEGGGGFSVTAGQGPYALDEVEEFGALLADAGLAAEVAEATDVGAQRAGRFGLDTGPGAVGGAGLGRGHIGTAHRCGSLQSSSFGRSRTALSDVPRIGGGRGRGCGPSDV